MNYTNIPKYGLYQAHMFFFETFDGVGKLQYPWMNGHIDMAVLHV